MFNLLFIFNLLQSSMHIRKEFNFFLHRFKFVGIDKYGDPFTMLGDDERSFSFLNLFNKIRNSGSNFGERFNIFVNT